MSAASQRFLVNDCSVFRLPALKLEAFNHCNVHREVPASARSLEATSSFLTLSRWGKHLVHRDLKTFLEIFTIDTIMQS